MMRRVPLSARSQLACLPAASRRPGRAQASHATRSSWPLCTRSYASTTDAVGDLDADGTHSAPLLREPPRNIAVLGGGITGLTTAYILRRELPDESKITLYESSDRLGGWIETTEVPVRGQEGQRIRFERGPRMIKSLDASPNRFDDLVLWDILRDAALPAVGFFGLSSYLYGRNGDLVDTSNLVKMLRNTTDQPIRLLWEFGFRYVLNKLPSFLGGISPPSGDDVSVTEWVRQQLGSEDVVDRSVSAILHGITGGDPDTTSMREFSLHMYRNLYYNSQSKLNRRRPSSNMVPVLPEDRELFLAMNPMLRQTLDRPVHHYALADGMQSLTDWIASALASQNNIELRTGTPVEGVRYDPSSDRVVVTGRENHGAPDTRSFDAVVSALPARRLVAVATQSSLPSLQYSPTVSIQTVNLWYPRDDLVPQKSLGYLIPRSATRDQNPHRALGALFDSEAIPPVEGEPRGTKLFVLLGGHYYNSELSPPADDATAIQQARETLEKHLNIPLSLEPGAAVARLAKDCLPQFEVGHAKRMAKAHEELLAAFSGRLCVAGPSYKGTGVLGCMRAGWDTAMRLAGRVESEHLGETGLARFANMSSEGIMPDVFVEQELINQFRPKVAPSFTIERVGPQKEHQKQGR